MNIKIIDNFLNKSYHKEILNLLDGPNFPWYYQSNITDTTKEGLLNSCGFTHSFIHEEKPTFNNYYFLILPLLLKIKDEINVKKILRSRGDMTMYSSKKHIHNYHVDYIFPNIATIYYVNDSDGDTFFKNTKQSIKPKGNRLVVFDGSIQHTGSSPTSHKNRILINSNFMA